MKVLPLGQQDVFSQELGGPGFLLKTGKELILIDVPKNINLILKNQGLSPLDLTAIFITHLHNDHIAGLIELIQYRLLCLSSPKVFKDLGFFSQIVKPVIPIYVLGFNRVIWRNIRNLIKFNSSVSWSNWTNHHDIVVVPENIESGSIEINDLIFDFKQGLHSTKCCGLKINKSLGISGDTIYDKSFFDWLLKDSKLVFCEAGYAGSHVHQKYWAVLQEQHNNLFFYHVPFPFCENLKDKNWLVELKWYEV